MTDDRLSNLASRLCCTALASLAACGGGGSSTPPSPPPPMASSFTPATGTAQVVEGAPGQFTFTVQVTNPDAGTLVPVVQPDSSDIVQVGAVDTSVANRYVVTFATVPGIAGGSHKGTISFRLCSDSNCTTAHAGGTQSLNYDIGVKLKDWGTFQRNAAHTGFVDVTLNPAKFAPAWTWQRPDIGGDPIGAINAVATGQGLVFVTNDIYFGPAVAYALEEATGMLKWTYAIGQMHAEGPAAFADGVVYVPSQDGSEQTTTWALNAATGTYKFGMKSGGQWQNFFAPTVLGDTVAQVNYDGGVYAFNSVDGTAKWNATSNTSDQSTPALDATRFYAYGAVYGKPALHIYDRATGAVVATIADPFAGGGIGYDMFSATMLGGMNDALAFSGSAFSGRAASSSEHYESRVIVSYDLAHASVGWRSANAYLTHPALANGVVYAARNGPASFDALSETDGHLLWSWTPPADEAGFHRNVVVTRNLAFVSTTRNVYAIDLTTHQAVWQTPHAGMLAISGGGLLLISTGAQLSDGGLVAIKLM